MAILANESGGSSILLETNNLLRIVALVDNTQEERAKMVSEMWSVLFYLCKSEVLALKMLSIVKIERIRKGKTFTRFFTYIFFLILLQWSKIFRTIRSLGLYACFI